MAQPQSQFIDPFNLLALGLIVSVAQLQDDVAMIQGDITDLKGAPVVTHSFSGLLTNERLIQGGAGVTVNIGSTRVTISAP